MEVECTNYVGFHTNFGTFRQSERSKTPPRSAIIKKSPLNPTYSLYEHYQKLSPILFFPVEKLDAFSLLRSLSIIDHCLDFMVL